MAETVALPIDRTGNRAQTHSAVARDLVVIAGWFVGLSVVYWAAVLVVCGRTGFPLDDSFIHLQFARNFYEDGQMAFKPGVPSSGSTAPLYPVLIAGVFHFVRDWYLAAHVLGALCSLGTAIAVYGIIRSWTGRPDLARWAGILTVFAAPTVVQAYSGMESAAYSLLLLVGLWLYGSRARHLVASTVLALGIWLRPELACLGPLILLERAVSAHRQGGRWVTTWMARSWPHVVIWGAMAAAYVLYHWHQDHHLVPSTFTAKVLVSHGVKPTWLETLPPAVRNHHWGLALLALTVWPVLVLVIAGLGVGTVCAPVALGLRKAIFALWRDTSPKTAGWRLAILMLVGYPLARGMVDNTGVFWMQQHRYYAHLTPLMILIVIGAISVSGAIDKSRQSNRASVDLAIQKKRTFWWASIYLVVLGAITVISVSNINSMQVRIAEWLRANTAEHELIAANDIGAIAFVSRRPILDTIGLVEPELAEHLLGGGDLLAYLQRRDPTRVVIFPNWYKELSARDDLLQPVYSVELDCNVACGGPKMVVYRPLWNDEED